MPFSSRLFAAAGAVALCLATSAVAAQQTPVGLWKTIDDETHTEKSLVRITESGGVLTGRIERLLDPAVPADAVCEKCEDERKDRPLVGMTLIRDVRPSDEKGLWSGGDIVDPNNGKVYRVRLKPIAHGTRLEVRGHIGTPIFGRTQTWIRVE